MKTKFSRSTYRGKEVFRFVAKIPRRADLGIPKSFQKTWRAFITDPMFKDGEIKDMFLAEARRWYLRVMTGIFGEKAPEVIQQEMVNNNETNESNNQHSEDNSSPSGEDARDPSEGTTPVEGLPRPDAGDGHEGGQL